MVSEREIIDIANNPDLLHLAEEVRRRNASAVLRNGDEDMVVVMPLTTGSRPRTKHSPFGKKSQADIDAFLSAAGGWKDLVDTEQLKRDIAESRARSSRPPIKL